MSDWNYGELINRRPHSHSVASNSTQPMETELSREREAHNKTKRERDEARAALREIANASHFDNIGNWARNKAKKALGGIE